MDTSPSEGPDRADARRPRPVLERIGLAVIALLMAALFAALAVASFAGGDGFLGTMAVIGAFMVLWVGAISALRG